MDLIFEKSVPGRACRILPPCDVEDFPVPGEYARLSPLRLPELSEPDISRHYTALSKRAFGVNCGFYPLGSCTMKYNPRINEEAAALPGFCDIHPLAPEKDVKGCLGALSLAGKYLCEITGMDDMTFSPAAGAHGELTGLLLIKAYHASRGDTGRTKLLIPDSAHGTNPASAAMAGFEVINIPSGPDGRVDADSVMALVRDDTAGIMLTNPNTLGLFERDVAEITRAVHAAGGLCYYDGANLNAVMGVARPGDMGFDAVHINLHKTFSTPHGGGGPGAGMVGVSEKLADFVPVPAVVKTKDNKFTLDFNVPHTIGNIASFFGNFGVMLKAFTYITMLGKEGLIDVSEKAVLNANYIMAKLKPYYFLPYDRTCMHEAVFSAKKQVVHGVHALDIAKALIDRGFHPPTIYFPLVVEEAIMIEPTETESKQDMDLFIEAMIDIARLAETDPDKIKNTPVTTPISRPDETKAAREPKLKCF